MIKYNFSYLASAFEAKIDPEEDIDKFISWISFSSPASTQDKQEHCLHANGQSFLKYFTRLETKNSLDILWSEDARPSLGNCWVGCPKGGSGNKCKFNRLVIPKELQYDNDVEAFFGKVEQAFANLQKKGWDAFQNASSFEVLVTVSFLCMNFYRSKRAMDEIYRKAPSKESNQLDYFKKALKNTLISIQGKTILFFRSFKTPLVLSKEHVLVAKKEISGIGATTNISYSDFIYAPLSRHIGCIIYSDEFKNQKFLNIRNSQKNSMTLPEYKVDMEFIVSNLLKRNKDTPFTEGNYLSDQLAHKLNLISLSNTLFSEYYGYDILGKEELEKVWNNRRKQRYAKISYKKTHKPKPNRNDYITSHGVDFT